MMPERIQRKRTKGYRLPEGAIYVGRPSKWGNPFVIGEVVPDDLVGYVHSMFPGTRGLSNLRLQSAETAAVLYDRWIVEVPPLMLSARDELGGRDLCCWCPLDQPCHADVLLEIANA